MRGIMWNNHFNIQLSVLLSRPHDLCIPTMHVSRLRNVDQDWVARYGKQPRGGGREMASSWGEVGKRWWRQSSQLNKTFLRNGDPQNKQARAKDKCISRNIRLKAEKSRSSRPQGRPLFSSLKHIRLPFFTYRIQKLVGVWLRGYRKGRKQIYTVEKLGFPHMCSAFVTEASVIFKRSNITFTHTA